MNIDFDSVNFVANDDTVGITEHETILVDVLANDIHKDGVVEIVSFEGLSIGSDLLSVVNNEIQFEPGDTFDALYGGDTATVTVTYSVSVGLEDYAEATLEITVNGESDNIPGPDNIITGTENGEVISGTVVDDVIYGLGGADYITLSLGNDVIDGGEGIDTMQVVGFQEDAVLSEFSIMNFEKLSLKNLGSNALNLTLQDLIDVTDADNELMILGESGDSVTSIGQGWILGADQAIDGQNYNTYTSGTGTLLIDDDITQTIS